MPSIRSARPAPAAALLALVLCGAAARAVAADTAPLRADLDQAMAVYAQDPARAREIAGDAFLRFESSGLDRSLAARDLAAYRSLESTWLRLVSAMRAGAPFEEVAGLTRRLVGELDAAAPPPASRGSLFSNALVIILREGFEAILILSAVAATLRAGGQVAGLPALGMGAMAGVAASLATAAAAQQLGGFGVGGEAFEGVTCLVAVVVLFLTSYWLVSRAEGRRWQQFINDSAERAAAGNRRGGLFVLAFVVVFREGFETVLFYQALAAEAAGGAGGLATVALGFAAGVVLLGLLYGGIAWFGVRIPVRQFFAVTGGLLYLLAIKFAGVGVRELQEAGWIEPAPLAWLPDVAWLRDWLGVVPDARSLALQAVLVAAVVGGLLVSRRRRRRPRATQAARRAA